MNKPRPYFILVEFRTVKINRTELAEKWCLEFGDFSRSVVKAELDDYKDRAERGTKKNFKIYKVPDAKQKTIENFLEQLNA